MRVLIFHGYLLGGTGSNVYNARLAAALVKLGHEVHLLCQDRHPERQPFVDAVGDWDEDALRVRALRERVLCTIYRPNIGGLLPVYVADRYEGIEARTFAACSDAEVTSYIDANVAAVREIVARASPDVALANHLVMGPVILARALADRRSRRSPTSGKVPYAVKVHGSALEYTVKPHPERFLDLAREGVAGAHAVLVGSHHTAASLWAALGDPVLPERTRLGPPGVDIDQFAPRDRTHARAGLSALSARLQIGGGDRPTEEAGDRAGEISGEDAFARDDSSAARALARIDPERDRLVAFVGKLIVSKGCDLLLVAWPLVLERVPAARLVVVGFGAYRSGLERLLAALSSGELAGVREIALAGRSLEAEASAGQTSLPPFEPKPLRHLLAFLDGLSPAQSARYVTAARTLPERVVLTGRLDHGELTDLLPACEALVVPSTFPEAFGMVAAEAAACGALPISAEHSGLAEVSGALAHAVPDGVAPWLSFPVDDSSVGALAERIVAWLTVDGDLREQTRAGLVRTVRERWSWEGVARGVIAAARGELDALAEP